MGLDVDIYQNETMFGFLIRSFRINAYADMKDKENTFYILVVFKVR